MKRLVFIGLGSNMGDIRQNLRRALDEIEERGLARVIRRSSLYLTEPVGFKEQDDFINAAAMLETELEPKDLLEGILEVEKNMGRTRGRRDGPRIIDLDILLCGDEVIREKGLEVPHPRLGARGFVLYPLAEIGPDEIHPVSGLTVLQMLSLLDECSKVERLEEKL